MIQFFLDVMPEPTLVEKAKSHVWLIVIAIAALIGIVAFFIWRNKKNKQKSQ